MVKSKFNPKVSIIIPVYNGSNYLKEAIESALAQTYKNIEVIVINDGSNDKDATEKIAKSYGKKIKYYKKTNGGVATALNLGIKKMTGEYFSWLSHDDLYYPDKIEKQINFLQDLDDKKIVLYSNYALLREGKITPVINHHEMLVRKKKYSLLRGCVNGITLLIPKSIFDETGQFAEELRCTQDYDYWQRIQKKYDFVHMEDVLSITRLHEKQDSNVSPRVVIEGNALWIKMIKNLSKEEKLQYESTLYNFYFEMIEFLNSTPYVGALDFCKTELRRLKYSIEKERFCPAVSVVIPFYNRIDKTLNAVKSVLNQTYKNIEIILINDGSTDDITKIEKLVNRQNNIKLLSFKSNMGPSAARNLGIKFSAGEYIAFLDSDDEFLPGKIEKQLEMMHKHNHKVSYTAYMRNKDSEKSLICDTRLNGLVIPRIISNCTIATPTVIILKQLLIDHNLRFDETVRIGEDTIFWLQVAKYSEILLVKEPLTIVSVDEESHAQNRKKLLIGIKNLINYLVTDDYYSKFDHDLAVLFRYFSETENEVQDKELNRIYCDGPVSSIKSTAIVKDGAVSLPIKALLKSSIPIRAARKLYREGFAATVRAAVKKKRISN